MILQKLTAASADGSRVMLWFDDGTKMRVAARIITGRGLYAGNALSEEDLAALQEAARRASAKDRAVRIVSTTAISERELKRRLVQRGESAEDAAEAADWLRDLGALDDEAMARRIVRRCADKGYGALRARQELQQKGIPREYWEEALAQYPDMSAAIDRFLAQKLSDRNPDRKELSRVIAALQRRGHDWEEIRSALNRFQDGEDPSFYE